MAKIRKKRALWACRQQDQVFVFAAAKAPVWQEGSGGLCPCGDPNCDIGVADLNADREVNFFDIDPFVGCLFGGPCP